MTGRLRHLTTLRYLPLRGFLFGHGGRQLDAAVSPSNWLIVVPSWLVCSVVGVVGAVVGGFIAQFAGFAGISGFTPYSLLIAIGGAVVVLLLYHALSRPRSTA